MKRIYLVLITIVLLSSCAIHSGTVSMAPVSGNVHYQRQAVAYTKSYKVLGIGSLGHDAMILDAKQRLFANNPLGKNETFVNFTLDFKNSYYLLFSQTRVTLSADVVSFAADGVSDNFGADYRKSLGVQTSSDSGLFAVGDSVIFDKYEEGVIQAFADHKTVQIQYHKNGVARLKERPLAKIYTTQKGHRSCIVGGSYVYEEDLKGESKPVVGKIVGLGENDFLVKKQDANSRIRVNYTDIK